jgi:hypothetical protein
VTPARQPVVWTTALLGLLSALVTAGLIQQDDADRFGPLVEYGVPVVLLIISVVGGLLARRRTVPVAGGTPPAAKLTRGFDAVYRTPSDDNRHRLVEKAEVQPKVND